MTTILKGRPRILNKGLKKETRRKIILVRIQGKKL